MRTHIVKNRFVLPVLALAMLLAACDNSDCAPQWRISDGPHMGECRCEGGRSGADFVAVYTQECKLDTYSGYGCHLDVGGVLFDPPGSPTCDLAGFGGQP